MLLSRELQFIPYIFVNSKVWNNTLSNVQNINKLTIGRIWLILRNWALLLNIIQSFQIWNAHSSSLIVTKKHIYQNKECQVGSCCKFSLHNVKYGICCISILMHREARSHNKDTMRERILKSKQGSVDKMNSLPMFSINSIDKIKCSKDQVTQFN